MNISQVLKSLFVSIGFISTIQLGFTPIVVIKNHNKYTIETELEGAITKDLEDLLHSGTDIGISFYTTIYSGNKKWTYSDKRQLSYKSLTNEYKLFNNSNLLSVSKDRAAIYNDFITVRHLFDRDFTLVVIKADLDIPAIKDQTLIASLWANITPRVSYKIREED